VLKITLIMAIKFLLLTDILIYRSYSNVPATYPTSRLAPILSSGGESSEMTPGPLLISWVSIFASQTPHSMLTLHMERFFGRRVLDFDTSLSR
jgi:hypothetical protein